MYICWVLFLLVIIKIIIPDINQIKIIKESIKRHEEKINLAYRKKNALYTLKTSKNKIWAEIQNIVNSQKEGREISTIVNFISRTAKNNGIEIQTIQVDEIRKKENHLELPLQCTLKGKFHPLCYFINGMENSDMIIKLESIKISSQHIVTDELKIQINLRVFYLGRIEV